MRTKALVATAALLAVGALSSMAQSNVYSVNVVGYINYDLKPGFNLIANQLDLDGTEANNTVTTTFGTQLPSGSTVYAFSGGGYLLPAATYSTKGGWANAANGNPGLAPGKGVFVNVPSAVTVTMVGNVLQGALNNAYNAGFNIISSKVPQAGLIQTDLGFAPVSGLTIYQYNATSQTYVSPFRTWSTKGGWNVQPNLAVGEAIFLNSPSASTWSRNFTVQ